jgi:hypothetical protein
VPAYNYTGYGIDIAGNCFVSLTTSGGGNPGSYIAGPCWGLYKIVEKAGICAGESGKIQWYTAVIGNGYSYWLKLAEASYGSAGAVSGFGFTIENIFTPL